MPSRKGMASLFRKTAFCCESFPQTVYFLKKEAQKELEEAVILLLPT
jgi:hypothetical protein